MRIHLLRMEKQSRELIPGNRLFLEHHSNTDLQGSGENRNGSEILSENTH